MSVPHEHSISIDYLVINAIPARSNVLSGDRSQRSSLSAQGFSRSRRRLRRTLFRQQHKPTSSFLQVTSSWFPPFQYVHLCMT